MLARAACRILSLFCAMLCIVVGAHASGGRGKPSGERGSERKSITDALLATVARGYPPQRAMHAIRVSGAGCKLKKMMQGPADASRRFAAGKQ